MAKKIQLLNIKKWTTILSFFIHPLFRRAAAGSTQTSSSGFQRPMFQLKCV
jgi:hypothetical protein